MAFGQSSDDALPGLWMLGQGRQDGGTRGHCDCRENMLERLKVRSPPLSSKLDGIWPVFRRRFARALGAKYRAAVGVRLVEIVRNVMTDLGNHLLTEDGFGPVHKEGDGLTGDPDAFAHFIQYENAALPKETTSLVV